MNQWKHVQVGRNNTALDPSTGDSYQLNETGAFVLKNLQNDIPPEQIARALHDTFSVSIDTATTHVYDFIATLKMHGDSQ